MDGQVSSPPFKGLDPLEYRQLMSDSDRIAAVCDRCGSVYTAWDLSDRIRPVGTNNCACGSDEFRKLT